MKSMLSHPLIFVVAVIATILCRTTMAVPPTSIETDSPQHEFDHRDNESIKSMVLDDITSLLSQYKTIASGVLPIYKRTMSDAYKAATFPVDWEAPDDVKSLLRSAVFELKDEVISQIDVDFEEELKLILDTAKTQFLDQLVTLFFGVGKQTVLTANKEVFMNDLMNVKYNLDAKLTIYLLHSFPDRTLLFSMERVILHECYKKVESHGPSENYDWEVAVKGVKLMMNKFKEQFKGPIQSAKDEVQRLNVTSSLPTLRGAYFDVLPIGDAVSNM